VGCATTKQKYIIGAILHVSKDKIPYSFDGKLTETWTPTKEIIQQIQPDILKYIEISNKRIFKNINKYRCQYFGIIVKGRKIIYCNFFWLMKEDEDWKISPIIYFDGGEDYFQLEYDIEKKKCLNFTVNGEA
jgi:hypothetical protein